MGESGKKKLVGFLIFSLFIIISLVMTYKARLATKFDDPVKDTWSWSHKHPYERQVVLDASNSHLVEKFLCTVPDLRQVSIYVKKQELNDGARLIVALSEADGEQVASKTFSSSDLSDKDFTVLELEFEAKADSKDNFYDLNIDAENVTSGGFSVNANTKHVLATSFNGIEEDKTNVVYDIRYGNASNIRILFALLAICFILLTVLTYYLFMIKGYGIARAFWPIAVIYGIMMLIVVPVNGVPDEGWHLDTAYKYSNYICGVGSTGNAGSIFKRKCDAALTDMLPYDIETGSYYQMVEGLFEKPKDTDLIEVSYYDSSGQVTFLNFLPAAIGLSIGRLLGLSSVLTYQFARLLSFLVYAAFIYFAIRIAPLGKEVLAMSALLPILVQQAASFSYDGFLMGAVYLFIALCLYLMVAETPSVIYYVLCALLVVYLALTKGAVYLPVVLLILVIKRPAFLTDIKISKGKLAVLIMAVLLVLITFAVVKYMPILGRIVLSQKVSISDKDSLSLAFMIKHPFHVLILIWNTIFVKSDKLFFGAFGGVFGWNDIEVVGMLPVLNFLGLLLLANCTGGKFITHKLRVAFLAGGILSMGLITVAMILAETSYTATAVNGLQGRYFVPQIFMIIMSVASERFEIKETYTGKIMTMMLSISAFTVLQVFAMVVG